MPTTVMIVDDHEVVRDGIQMILSSLKDMSVVATAADGMAAVTAAEKMKPDVIVMDISMPLLNGLDAMRRIKEKQPQVKVIVLSMHNSPEYVQRAVSAGVQGYVLKQSAGVELIKAIRTVIKGHSYYGKGIEVPARGSFAGDFDTPDHRLDLLSSREVEVLKYVVDGKTSAEIAEILFLSPKTVETYRSRLMQKLGADSIPALVRFALRHGIIVDN